MEVQVKVGLEWDQGWLENVVVNLWQKSAPLSNNVVTMVDQVHGNIKYMVF